MDETRDQKKLTVLGKAYPDTPRRVPPVPEAGNGRCARQDEVRRSASQCQWSHTRIALKEIELWTRLKKFPAAVRHSELRGSTTPTLAEFRTFRHISSTRVPEPKTIQETAASNEDLDRLQEVLSTLTPSRVRFLCRQRQETCRLNPGCIPRLADVQFLERTLRVLDTWDRQRIDVG